MNVTFLGQGYNLEKNSSLAKELIQLLKSKEYHTFKVLVAFASFGGVSALSPHIKSAQSHLKNIRLYIGIDNGVTSKEALQEVLLWKVSAFTYHTKARNIFHPKIYVFEGDEKITVIIGSNNLTEMGLVKNVEAAIKVEYNKAAFKSNSLLDQIENYFFDILNENDIHVHLITQKVIDDFTDMGILPDESQRRKTVEEKINTDLEGKKELTENQSGYFGKVDLQKKPSDFKPKRRPKRKQKKKVKKNTPKISNTQLVLIAEIGRGSRWRQVNFPVEIFEEFFGAKRGDNSYHIKLQHVTTDGLLEEVEERQAVSVKSNNFRFEIGAAKGNYPTPRPIGIFIKTGKNKFLYYLVMPDSKYYNDVESFLNIAYNGPRRNLKRITLTVEGLKAQVSSLPFW